MGSSPVAPKGAGPLELWERKCLLFKPGLWSLFMAVPGNVGGLKLVSGSTFHASPQGPLRWALDAQAEAWRHHDHSSQSLRVKNGL